jgi:hypothetical protein
MTGDMSRTRAGTVDDLTRRLGLILTPQGQAMLESFTPEPDDVFIVTPAKCGTTWMQQIVHGLRSGGSMSYSNINAVVPWLGISEIDPVAARAAQGALRPHAFKSHAPLGENPSGAKYIVVLRDPAAAAVSQYRFFADAFLDPDGLDFETFVRGFILGQREVHDHVLEAWPRRRDDDVLLLCYESMLADLPGTVDAVAEFIGVTVTPALREVVVEQSGMDFMKAHESKFDDAQGVFESFRDRLELPPASSLSKVAPDEAVRPRPRLTDDLRAELDAAWRADVTPSTGLASYADLRAAVDQLAADD